VVNGTPQLSKLGVTSVRTPFWAPRANAIAERLVRSIRRECLDHLIVINERHLRAVLVEFADLWGAKVNLHGLVGLLPSYEVSTTSTRGSLRCGWLIAPLQHTRFGGPPCRA